MHALSRRLYGLLDYLFGLFLIASPRILDFSQDISSAIPQGSLAQSGLESVIPIVIGINLLVLALITNAEWGIARMISFETHLALDLAAGVLLMLSPWLFGFAGQVFMPHVLLGLFLSALVLLVRRTALQPDDAPGYADWHERHG